MAQSTAPNRETTLPMAPGSCAQAARGGPGQGGPMVNRDSWLKSQASDTDRTSSQPDSGSYTDGETY